MSKKELTGIIEEIDEITPCRKGRNYFLRIKVSGLDFRWFDTENGLRNKRRTIKAGDKVRIGYRESIKESGAIFRAIGSLKKIDEWGAFAPSPERHVQEFSIVSNGKLELARLKMALKVISMDCDFLYKELEKVKE